MKRVLLAFVVVIWGCPAEGELVDPDMSADFAANNFNNLNNQNNQNNVDPDMTILPDGGYEFGEACDVFMQDCSANGKCVPNPGSGEATCLALGEQRNQGEACETITQCASGLHCASTPDDPTNLCRRMCDPNGVDTCPGGETCSLRLNSIPSIGLCVEAQTACDIYTQDCASGSCILTTNIGNGQEGTFCGQPGIRGAGETCGNGQGECQEAMICVQLAGEPSPTCQHVCRIGTRQCPDMSLSCIGQSASTGITFCKTP